MSPPRPRCLWCHQPGGDLVPLELEGPAFPGWGGRPVVHVHPEHREDLLALQARASRGGSLFLKRVFLLLAAIAAIEVVLVLWQPRLALLGIGLAVLALGVLLVRSPFPTPQTIQLFGARRAVRLVRASGWAVAVLGLLVMAASLLL